MVSQRFEEFINQHTVQTVNSRSGILLEWQENLKALYNTIELYLKPFTENNKIKITYQDVQLHEDGLGDYTVQEATITFGEKTLSLKPIGTLLIGAKGRVDLTGAYGSAKLIFADFSKFPEISTTAFQWMIPNPSKAAIGIYVPLTQEAFLEVFMEVAADG
jgi:hypothetical protein